MAADDLDPGKTTLLAAAERDGRPGFCVGVDGAVAWAGANAGSLIGFGPLDPATRRMLARMAASGAGGLLRLRIGALGRFAPLTFQAKPFETADGTRLLAVEGLSRVAERQPETPGGRDVADEEGAHQEAGLPSDDGSNPAPASQDGDTPPDPRRDLLAGGSPTLETPIADEPEPAADPTSTDEPFRFAFEIDERSCLTLLSREFDRALGPSARLVGRSWDDVASEFGLDPDGDVATALSKRGGWGDIKVVWPLADGRRRMVALSALPMFDRGRSFIGYRGLGRSVEAPFMAAEAPALEHAATASASVTTPEAPIPLETALIPPDAQDDGSAATVSLPEEVLAAAPPATVEPASYEPPSIVLVRPLSSPVFEGNVVALREAPAPQPALSSSEEDAFDEIARRLKAFGPRAGDERLALDAETPSPREPADERQAPPFAAGADELFRLIDRQPVGSLVLRGGEIAHANRAALEMLGCREMADLSGRGADTLFADALPKDREAPAGAMRLIAADGGEVDVDARLSTIAWGGSPATLVVLRRPDASVAAAAESVQRERELAAALDISTDGVMTLDGQGRILSVNRGAESLFGFSAREVVGSLFTLSLAPESRRAAFDCLDRLKSNGTTPERGVEVMGLARQGGAAPLLMTIGRLPAADRFCAALRDIGPWKRAEEELIASRRLAERANEQKSEFLAKVGHEIRTPLNAIIGFAEVMHDERFGPIGSPRYKDYLRDIQSSGAHLVKMMDDLLDVSRIETGKLKLDMSPVDLNEIASQAAALLQPQANRDRVIIRTSLARGLPHVMADRRSVRQIMTNLAMNAVKLSRPGGQVIVATALTDIGQAVFRVRDAGAGLSKQELARAFEPFRPLDVADNDAGSGLGLPLMRALAEANDAALALQSELGLGTLAEVTFPASRVLAS